MEKNLKIVDHPLIQHKLSIMRDQNTPSILFRQLLREISQLLAFEATRDLALQSKTVQTPMKQMQAVQIAGKKLALISILRAGNGMLDGVLDVIPCARVGFAGMYRDEDTLQPVQYYFKAPEDLGSRLVLAVDPMLATGNSAVAAIDLLKEKGAVNIQLLCLLAAPEGVARIAQAHPDVTIITAALDEKLDENGYIIPGLGDAGDRIFGTS